MKKTVKFFKAGKPMDWHKTDSQVTRRKNALKAHKGNYLATARALLQISNITQDNQTRIKAKVDSNHFFALHKKTKK
jgi:hypothetical protein